MSEKVQEAPVSIVREQADPAQECAREIEAVLNKFGMVLVAKPLFDETYRGGFVQNLVNVVPKAQEVKPVG